MKTQETQVSFRLRVDLLEAMRAIKDEVGIPISEQLRRGLEMWIAKHGPDAKKKAGRK